MFEPGQIIAGRYEIVRKIGEGGMGMVFEAKHTALGKRVAIKVLSKQLTHRTDAVKRFHLEARIAGSIGHINICEVIDFGTTKDGFAFLVMEYLTGETVADILARQGTLPVNVALRIISQVLDALEEVHSRGIIHRDLKPENLFVTEVKGHGVTVKVLDFGISKVTSAEAPSMSLTKTGAVIGTPYYMSPEQIRGSKDVNNRTDLYSCGAILYEMVTGEVPYGGETFTEVLSKILEEDIPDPSKIVSSLPEGIVRVVRRALEKNPQKRYQSAEEFKRDVDNLMRRGGAVVSPHLAGTSLASQFTRLKKPGWIDLRKIYIAGGAVTLIVLVFLISFYSIRYFVHSESERGDGRGGYNKSAVSIEADDGKLKLRERDSAGGSSVGVEVKESVESKKKEPELVRIKFTNLPRGAVVKSGDKVAYDGILEVERSDRPIEVLIQAKGYKDRRIILIPSRNMNMDGRLERSKTTVGRKKRVKKRKVKTVSTKKKPSKKKPSLIWDY